MIELCGLSILALSDKGLSMSFSEYLVPDHAFPKSILFDFWYYPGPHYNVSQEQREKHRFDWEKPISAEGIFQTES
jgi:hypothetical protein